MNGKDIAEHKELTEKLTLELGKRLNKPVISGSDTHQAVQYGCIKTKFNETVNTCLLYTSGVLHTLNDVLSDVVQSDSTAVLYGNDYFYETLLGLKFKISAFSFFQTNSRGAEKLYSVVREFAGDTSGKVVFDLYCGTGTIGQIMSEGSKKVIGIEIVEEAVKAANDNAVLNGIENCTFIAGDVLKKVEELEDKPDLIIVDPPRDGINPKAVLKIINFGAKEIVYVSCKPTSLARDLQIFEANGYKVKKVKMCIRDRVICPGQLKFTGYTSEYPLHTSSTCSGVSLTTAAMEVSNFSASFCISSPRFITSLNPVSLSNTPAAVAAVTSPRENPANASGFTPLLKSTSAAASSMANRQGCVFFVSFNSSSVPSKHCLDAVSYTHLVLHGNRLFLLYRQIFRGTSKVRFHPYMRHLPYDKRRLSIRIHTVSHCQDIRRIRRPVFRFREGL